MKIIKDFKQWKIDNPDTDYQYDEVWTFLERYTRGDLIKFLNEIEQALEKTNNQQGDSISQTQHHLRLQKIRREWVREVREEIGKITSAAYNDGYESAINTVLSLPSLQEEGV